MLIRRIVALLLVVFIAPAMLAGGDGARAQTEAETPASITDIEQRLRELIASPDGEAITVLVETQRARLAANPEHAVLAAIALGRGKADPGIAVEFTASAEAAIAPRIHRRLRYERALALRRNNDCAAAMPHLHWLVRTGNSGDPLRLEAALMQADCARIIAGWWNRLTAIAGYTDDFSRSGAGGGERVTPEAGSRLDTIITALEDAYPGGVIPREYALGTKPVAAAWAGLRGSAGKQWAAGSEDGIRHKVFVSGDIRKASKEGFGELSFTAQGRRQKEFGAFRTATVLTGVGRYVMRGGEAQEDLRVASIGLDTSMRMALDTIWDGERQTRFANMDAVIGLRGAVAESRSAGRSNVNSITQYIGLAHLPGVRGAGLRGLGWQAELGTGVQSGSAYAAARASHLALALGPVAVGADGDGRLYLGVRLTEIDYSNARPWLASPHNENRRDILLRLTYPFGSGKAVTTGLAIGDVRSRDAVDKGRKASLEMEFHF